MFEIKHCSLKNTLGRYLHQNKCSQLSLLM